MLKGIKMILIIDKSKKTANDIANMLYYMGVIAVAKTPKDALSEISTAYRAVIISNPNALADKSDYTARLRTYVPNVPVFALSDSVDDYDRAIYEKIFPTTVYGARLLTAICDYTEESRLKTPGIYRLAGIDASRIISCPLYLGHPLPFTKTESMILRVLIRTYPVPIKPKKILDYAFRESRAPDVSNVRTHISVMNKKFREISGRNLIQMSVGEGYRILTPEILESKIII